MVTVVRHFMSTVVSHKLLFYRNFRVNREINTIILSTFLQTVIFKCIHVNYPIVSSRAFPEDVGGGGGGLWMVVTFSSNVNVLILSYCFLWYLLYWSSGSYLSQHAHTWRVLYLKISSIWEVARIPICIKRGARKTASSWLLFIQVITFSYTCMIF